MAMPIHSSTASAANVVHSTPPQARPAAPAPAAAPAAAPMAQTVNTQGQVIGQLLNVKA